MGVIADKIRRAIFGGEVRDSIADGIEVVEQLREDYDNQVINAGNSNAEIVDARGGQTKLKDRLDNFDEQLDNKAKQLDLEIERNRINNLTSLKAGSTTGDGELIVNKKATPSKFSATSFCSLFELCNNIVLTIAPAELLYKDSSLSVNVLAANLFSSILYLHIDSSS